MYYVCIVYTVARAAQESRGAPRGDCFGVRLGAAAEFCSIVHCTCIFSVSLSNHHLVCPWGISCESSFEEWKFLMRRIE